jgi:hypothetical protein
MAPTGQLSPGTLALTGLHLKFKECRYRGLRRLFFGFQHQHLPWLQARSVRRQWRTQKDYEKAVQGKEYFAAFPAHFPGCLSLRATVRLLPLCSPSFPLTPTKGPTSVASTPSSRRSSPTWFSYRRFSLPMQFLPWPPFLVTTSQPPLFTKPRKTSSCYPD